MYRASYMRHRREYTKLRFDEEAAVLSSQIDVAVIRILTKVNK